MYKIVGKILEGRKVVGYVLTNGTETKDVPLNTVLQLAKEKKLVDIRYLASRGAISGANGFELKKLPSKQINGTQTKPMTKKINYRISKDVLYIGDEVVCTLPTHYKHEIVEYQGKDYVISIDCTSKDRIEYTCLSIYDIAEQEFYTDYVRGYINKFSKAMGKRFIVVDNSLYGFFPSLKLDRDYSPSILMKIDMDTKRLIVRPIPVYSSGHGEYDLGVRTDLVGDDFILYTIPANIRRYDGNFGVEFKAFVVYDKAKGNYYTLSTDSYYTSYVPQSLSNEGCDGYIGKGSFTYSDYVDYVKSDKYDVKIARDNKNNLDLMLRITFGKAKGKYELKAKLFLNKDCKSLITHRA